MNEEQSLASGISILVSVIAFTVWCYWDSIKEFFGVRREVIRLENTVDQLGTELERKAQEIWCAEQAEQDSARM